MFSSHQPRAEQRGRKARTASANRLLGAVTATLLVAGCSGDSNIVRDAAVATGLQTKLNEPADFVKNSRSGSTEFMPVGVSAPPRATKPRSPAEVKALEIQLEADRRANETAAASARAAGATPPPTAPIIPPVSP